MRFARIENDTVMDVVESKGFEYMTHLTKHFKFVQIPNNLELQVEQGWKFINNKFSKEGA